MSDDDTRSDDYWMGVRDSLRMVDSFLKWSARNPEKAKSLEDFVHDGLIAAAKRCESCLSDKLGVKFESRDDDDDDDDDDEEIEEQEYEDDFESTPVTMVESATETLSEAAPEEPISFDESIEEPSMEDGEGVSLESVERIEDEDIGEFDIEGPPRDFSTDFVLVEPSPMSSESSEESDSIEESTEESIEEPEEEETEKPSFSWSDYETAVSPSEVSTDESLSGSEESVEGEPDSLAVEPEESKVWSPYDEPSIPEEELTREIAEDEPSLDEAEDEVPITEPPAPPPPPESDEDEEERKRRARRLFFGA